MTRRTLTLTPTPTPTSTLTPTLILTLTLTLPTVEVDVVDETEEHGQPVGKQRRNSPRHIWYTAVSGIWQTVRGSQMPAASLPLAAASPQYTSRASAVHLRCISAHLHYICRAGVARARARRPHLIPRDLTERRGACRRSRQQSARQRQRHAAGAGQRACGGVRRRRSEGRGARCRAPRRRHRAASPQHT